MCLNINWLFRCTASTYKSVGDTVTPAVTSDVLFHDLKLHFLQITFVCLTFMTTQEALQVKRAAI